MVLFSKKSLEKEDWKNSGDGVLLLVLLSFFASSGTVLKNAFTKKKKKDGENSGDGVLFKKKL